MKRQGLDSLATIIGPDAAMAAMLWFCERVKDACDARDHAREIARESGFLSDPSPASWAMFKAATADLADLAESWEYELRCEIAGGEG